MASYLRQVKTKVDMLKSIGDSNAVLKTRSYTYSQDRDELDLLIKQVMENKGDHYHILHGCKISKKYIKADNHLSTDYQFVKGVYQIKSGIDTTFSPSENDPVCAF